MQKIIENVKNIVAEKLKDDKTAHDFEHSNRVAFNSVKIAKAEILKNPNLKIDFFLLEISALLHDIADHKFGYTDLDREKIIQDILKSQNLSDEFIEKVVYIVNNVSFSKGKIPESIEGKIVQDADRLEAIGAIGIGRTFCYGGHKGRDFYDAIIHFHEKLYLLKNLMNTSSALEMAEERDKFMRMFEEQFNKEWNI